MQSGYKGNPQRPQVTLDALRNALGGTIERTDRGYQLRCAGPGHSAKDNSLTITLADTPRGYLFFSHAEDDDAACIEFIERKLGYPAPMVNGHANGHKPVNETPRRVDEVYDYRDEGGNLLFQVVRYIPKDFRQRSPAGNWSIAGIRRVLYRLPELLEAIGNGTPVFIVEGEKDVDALWKVGIPATCNPMGAGKWLPEFCDSLLGATCYIIPDEDKNGAGMRHARVVLDSLRQRNITAHPVRLGIKDVSDWLAAGGTADRLWAMVDGPLPELPDAAETPVAPPEAAPAPTEGGALPPLPVLNLGAWDGADIPEQQWAVRDRIPLRNVFLFGGHGATGKSTLELHRACAHATGRDWCGLMPEPGPAVVFNCEDDGETIARRIKAIGAHMGENLFACKDLHIVSMVGGDALLVDVSRTGVVTARPVLRQLRELCLDVRPVSLCIDACHNVFAGNENERAVVRQFVGLLHGLAIEAGCSVTLINHPSRVGLREGTGESGSTAWYNSVRAQAHLAQPSSGEDEKEASDNGLRVLEWRKSQYSRVCEPISLEWRNGLFLPVVTASNYEQAAKFNRHCNMVWDAVAKLIARGENVAPGRAAVMAAEVLTDQKQPLPRHVVRLCLDRLIQENRLVVIEEGPPSRRRSHIRMGSKVG